MQLVRGLHNLRPHHRGCVATIGNFDGVHRGHQAMLALLKGEAQQRGVPSCVLTFEPHPRDYFAELHKKPELAPARVGTLRDKLEDLAKAGVDQTVVLPFDARLAGLSPEARRERLQLRFEDGEIRFDYTMRPGPVTRALASAFKRKVASPE